ncbi:MAG: hypothetical protein A2Z27_02940 [candidate division Zixibacteria bacterium RBG_16_50_21]|nr:MAG: hypothetical protein A2Z27_02940 [candidate division Zixibacteria bacterium RBG_16_50_21]
MKTLKIASALILTLALLFVARKLAMVQPRVTQITQNNLSIVHLNPGKTLENQLLKIKVRVTGIGKTGEKVLLSFVYGQPAGEWGTAEMKNDTSLDFFVAEINGQPRGGKLYYYVEIQDSLNNTVASLGSEQNPLRLRFEGAISAGLLIPHIFCMFAGAFFSFLALFGAIGLLKSQGDFNSVARKVGWAALFIFIGGFPLGILVTRAALGGSGWGGFPIGNDITDSKTLLIFIYWLVLVVLGKGSIFGNRPEGNLVKPVAYGVLTLIGFLSVLGLYLIPHSI